MAEMKVYIVRVQDWECQMPVAVFRSKSRALAIASLCDEAQRQRWQRHWLSVNKPEYALDLCFANEHIVQELELK
jgi:hypothetical protein